MSTELRVCMCHKGCVNMPIGFGGGGGSRDRIGLLPSRSRIREPNKSRTEHAERVASDSYKQKRDQLKREAAVQVANGD